MKLLSMLLAAGFILRSFAADPCDEHPVYIESRPASANSHKHGYQEFVQESPPKIKYYLNKKLNTTTSSSRSWNNEPYQEYTTGGGYWLEGATHTGSDTSSYNATQISTIDSCSGAETHSFSGSYSQNYSETRTGTNFIRVLYAGVYRTGWSHGDTENSSSSETLSTDGQRGKWEGTYQYSYDVNWPDNQSPSPAEAFRQDSSYITESEYWVDEILPVQGTTTIDNPRKMTITAPPPPGGSAKTTIDLTVENTTDMFIQCIQGNMPPYPGNPEDWMAGQSTAKMNLNDAENATEGFPWAYEAQQYQFSYG